MYAALQELKQVTFFQLSFEVDVGNIITSSGGILKVAQKLQVPFFRFSLKCFLQFKEAPRVTRSHVEINVQTQKAPRLGWYPLLCP